MSDLEKLKEILSLKAVYHEFKDSAYLAYHPIKSGEAKLGTKIEIPHVTLINGNIRSTVNYWIFDDKEQLVGTGCDIRANHNKEAK